MTYEQVEEAQRSYCEELDQQYVAAPSYLKVGFARETRGKLPINGYRHPPEGDTTGWYLYCGEEFSSAADFFSPLHTIHLIELQPEVLKFQDYRRDIDFFLPEITLMFGMTPPYQSSPR